MKLDKAALLAALKKILPRKSEAPKAPISSTRRKQQIRAEKTRPRAACDSFRYRQQHQAELRRKRRAEQNDRRRRRLSAASSSLRKVAA